MKMQEYDPSEPEKKVTKEPQKKTPAKKAEAPQVPAPPKQPTEVGYETITGFPTGMLLYPDDTVIKGRPMSVGEVKMLANMTEENANDIINDILRKAVAGIDIGDLYASDKIYIMFWLRAKTYPESGYDVKFECGKCKKSSEFVFELNKLKIKELEDEDVDNLKRVYTSPSGLHKFAFKYLTVNDENAIEDFLKKNKNSMMTFDDDIINICRMIKTINGEKLGTIKKYEYLTTEMSVPDYAHLESYVESISVGLEPTLDVVCKKCGVGSETILPFRPDFFFPQARI